jgi:hypothetical protein
MLKRGRRLADRRKKSTTRKRMRSRRNGKIVNFKDLMSTLSLTKSISAISFSSTVRSKTCNSTAVSSKTKVQASSRVALLH